MFLSVPALALLPSVRCRLIGASCLVSAPSPDITETEVSTCELPEDISRNDGEALKSVRAGCRLAEIAHSFDRAQDGGSAVERQRLLDSYKWHEAQECTVGISDCATRSCYANYLAEFSVSGLHTVEAQAMQRQAEEKCSANALSSLADGRYVARSSAACGVKPESVTLEINHGEISWRHEFQGISFQWSGRIDSNGAIDASVGNSSAYSAIGRYNEADRNVRMTYPQCVSSISMQIISKMSN